MPPPPASSAASRILLGPALRAQSDRRLVSLVRDGYEAAFEEIVRRYDRALGRYAAAIVPSHRAEDVTQDAFSKALLALRDTDKEIELRPWLYRIARNTALNDIRDQPPPTAPLHEGIGGVETPAEAAERRAEIADLLDRLRALPEPQRAAIVMRELEGLSHEEIAAALGLSGGGARQAIYRARRTLRNGAGFLIPVPLLHFLLASAGAGAGAAAAGGAGAAGAASAGGAGAAGAASAGGAGAGLGIKAGIASVVVAGSVATGVAIDRSGEDRDRGNEPPVVRQQAAAAGSGTTAPAVGPGSGSSGEGGGEGSDRGHRGGDRSGPGDGGDRDDVDGRRGPSSKSGPGGGDDFDDDDDDDDDSGSGSSGSGSGSSEKSGSSGSGSGGSGSGGSGSGSDSGPGSGEVGDADDDLDDDSSGSGSSGSGSDDDD